MRSINDAIHQLNSNVVSIVNNKYYDADGNEVEINLEEAQALFDAKQYQEDRRYPSIQEQLDMQYWDAVNGTTTWKDAIAQVKADNPKPE